MKLQTNRLSQTLSFMGIHTPKNKEETNPIKLYFKKSDHKQNSNSKLWLFLTQVLCQHINKGKMDR